MAKKKAEEKINIDSILFKCRDILRAARNSGSFFEKRDMMLTLVFLRFIGEKFEDGVAKLREDLIAQGLDRLIAKRNIAFVKRGATIVSETQVCKFKCTICKRNASFVSKMQHL